MSIKKFLTNTKPIKKILHIAAGVCIFSGLMDLYLWVAVGALIPSWTMTAMALGAATLIEALITMMK